MAMTMGIVNRVTIRQRSPGCGDEIVQRMLWGIYPVKTRGGNFTTVPLISINNGVKRADDQRWQSNYRRPKINGSRS